MFLAQDLFLKPSEAAVAVFVLLINQEVPQVAAVALAVPEALVIQEQQVQTEESLLSRVLHKAIVLEVVVPRGEMLILLGVTPNMAVLAAVVVGQVMGLPMVVLEARLYLQAAAVAAVQGRQKQVEAEEPGVAIPLAVVEVVGGQEQPEPQEHLESTDVVMVVEVLVDALVAEMLVELVEHQAEAAVVEVVAIVALEAQVEQGELVELEFLHGR